MPTTFRFGFSQDDADGHEDDSRNEINEDIPSLYPPRGHKLDELLSALPSRIHYNVIYITSPLLAAEGKRIDISLRRRSLFDVILQLKAEAHVGSFGDHEDGQSVQLDSPPASSINLRVQEDGKDGRENGDELIARLEDRGGSDLSPGVYEGGFKTWECAVDLACFLASLFKPGEQLHRLRRWFDSAFESGITVVELGAGSAVPALTLLEYLLSRQSYDTERDENGALEEPTLSSHRFMLCDYNLAVLKLVTCVNVLLNLEKSRHMSQKTDDDENDLKGHEDEGELNNLDASLLQAIEQKLNYARIDIKFISGAWSKGLVDLCFPLSASAECREEPKEKQRGPVLVLASETIYSPDSLIRFITTLLSLLHRGGPDSRALVAAKRIYFGVGGGVDIFIREVQSQNNDVSVEVVQEVKSDQGGIGGGIGRVILEVKLNNITHNSPSCADREYKV